KTNVVDQDRVRRYTIGAGGTVATLRRKIGRHIRSGHYVSHSDAKAKGRQALKLVGYRALRESGAVREQLADKFNSYILPVMRGRQLSILVHVDSDTVEVIVQNILRNAVGGEVFIDEFY